MYDGFRISAACVVLFTVIIAAGCGGPHIGAWREETALNCTGFEPFDVVGGAEFEPDPIACLSLKGDGIFFIAHAPFLDVRCGDGNDGTYLAREGAMTMTFDLDTSRYDALPARFDGTGTFDVVDDDTLILTNIWLGRGDFGAAPIDEAGCGHRFRRIY